MRLHRIAEIVETEGLSYALTEGGYLRPEDFMDPDLRDAARKVIAGLEKLNAALEDYLP